MNNLDNYLNKLKVLYEDNHLIVVEKFVNVLSQADITGDLDMLTIIKEYLRRKYQKLGNVFLGLVHRLDRMTGGVMVFAKTSKAASRLSNSIRANEMEKRYVAIVMGRLPVDDHFQALTHKMTKDEKEVKSFLDEKGKVARLTYRCLAVKDNKSLIEVILGTGRHHQIRLQMSSIGYPLFGDTLYGGSSGNLALYSYCLTIPHPITKESLTFKTEPKGYPWNIFQILKPLNLKQIVKGDIDQ